MKKLATILFILGTICLFFGLIPTIINNEELLKINNEIKIISVSLNNKTTNKINIKKFEKSNYIFNQKNHDIVLNYLKKIIDVSSKIINLENDPSLINLLSLKNYNNDLSVKNNYLEEKNSEIVELNNSYNELLSYEIKIDNKNIYNNLKTLDISNYKKIIDDNLELINNYKELINYLSSTSYYKLENNSLVFLNKNSYSEYKIHLANFKNRNINIIPSKVLDDYDSPIIEVGDITIYEGVGVDVKKYAKCYDLVDGNLDCVVIGSFDKNTKGSYPIKISARDTSGNTSYKNININVVEREKQKYYTEIIRNQNTVIIYELDSNGEYSKIARVFPCSTGRGGRTPTGVFYSRKGHEWGSLMGGVYGQYYTVITGNILFHSVPYYSMSKGNLEYKEYNKLGSEASAGCVRVSVIDAKWIYDNCPSGMKIKIYDGELPEGVSKPEAIKIDENSPNRGWDPTDPDPNNPWNS